MSDFKRFKNLIGEKVKFMVTTNQVGYAGIICDDSFDGLSLKGNTVVFNDIFDEDKVKHNQTIFEILEIKVLNSKYANKNFKPIFELRRIEFEDYFGDLLGIFVLDLVLYGEKMKVTICFTQDDNLDGSFSPKIANAYTKDHEIILSNEKKSIILDFCYMHRDIMNYSRKLNDRTNK